jgi:hypothetical protein
MKILGYIYIYIYIYESLIYIDGLHILDSNFFQDKYVST